MADDHKATEGEIEAGASALAARYFLFSDQWPLSRFPASQQQDFREKARAVIEAAKRSAAMIDETTPKI